MAFDPNNPNSRDLQYAWGAAGVRRRQSLDLALFWDEDWSKLLDEKLQEGFLSEETYENVALFKDTTLNPLKWAVQKLGAIYNKPPVRTLDTMDPESSEAALRPYLANGTLDLTMVDVCQQTLLHRECLVRPMVVERLGAIELSWDIILPYQVEVIASSDPLLPSAVMYAVPVPQVEGSVNYVYWSKDVHGTLTSNWEWRDGGLAPNPYKMVPLTPYHATFPTRGFWHYKQSNALKEATLAAGVAMSHLRYLMKMQSFKQLNLSAEPTGKAADYLMDPGYALITPNGTAQILDWQADLSTQMEVILQQIGAVTNFRGIKPEIVKGGIDASSGEALKLKMHDLMEQWEKLKPLFTVFERIQYQVARAVWNYDAPRMGQGIKLLPEGNMQIEYADLGPALNPSEKADLMAKYQGLGMSSANVWRELGKDEEWIANNMEERMDEQAVFGQPLDIPGADLLEDDTSAVDVTQEVQ